MKITRAAAFLALFGAVKFRQRPACEHLLA